MVLVGYGLGQPWGHTSPRSKMAPHILENKVKLWKHWVTLIASTHRYNQVGFNVRSQFCYVMLKQRYGKDIFDFFNKKMLTFENEALWPLFRELITMNPEYVYVFDYKNNYDKLEGIKPIRPPIKYLISEEIQGEEEKRFDNLDLDIIIRILKGLGIQEIARQLDMQTTTPSTPD